jgi:hypothetical protein
MTSYICKHVMPTEISANYYTIQQDAEDKDRSSLLQPQPYITTLYYEHNDSSLDFQIKSGTYSHLSQLCNRPYSFHLPRLDDCKIW